MENADLAAAVDARRSVIRDRFPDDDHHGAAAMLLDDGTILTGTAPDAINPSVEVCHETEPYCAAFRLGEHIVASVSLHREPGGVWNPLKEVLPDYWMMAFPDEIDAGWTD